MAIIKTIDIGGVYTRPAIEKIESFYMGETVESINIVMVGDTPKLRIAFKERGDSQKIMDVTITCAPGCLGIQPMSGKCKGKGCLIAKVAGII
jgi:hypothetical protein